MAAAEATYRHAVEFADDRWAPTTKPAYRMRELLGNVLATAGRWSEARPLYETALAGYRMLLQPDHPDILTVAYQLGRAQRALGEIAAAATLFRESCDGRRAQFGDAHELTVASCTSLAELTVAAQ